MDHAGHEFYSDFNDYDVTVQVPANYVVWGTGTLTNASAVLQPTALGRLAASLASDSTIHVATGADTRAGTIDLQVPKLRTGSYFPDWLMERRKRAGIGRRSL